MYKEKEFQNLKKKRPEGSKSGYYAILSAKEEREEMFKQNKNKINNWKVSKKYEKRRKCLC